VFGSGVDLVVVNATVTDADGHFVPGLRKEDFVVREDGRPQTVTTFSHDRVPVSLGLALDTSVSMRGEKMSAAREALERLLKELLGRDDEVFLYCFSDEPVLVQPWTTPEALWRRSLGRISTGGLTALFDTTAEAVTLAKTGQHLKKALIVISDGNDTASQTSMVALRRQIQESEVLVYAIGLDASRTEGTPAGPGFPPKDPPRIPIPFPGPTGRFPRPTPPHPPRAPISPLDPSDGPVDAQALRMLTDDSGGRTEIIRSAKDLDRVTAGIADELSRQYFLGYRAPAGADGRWRAIDVRVEGRPELRVRARRGYYAIAGAADLAEAAGRR
jgi:Ca-activated chloride channel family protein